MSRQKNLKRNLLICLLAGSAVMYTLPLHAATSVVANNALPTLPMVNGQIKDGYGFVTGGNNTNIVTDGLQMNITQNDSNAAIKWGSFDVGGSATVNFDYTGKSDFNTLNYVNSASASQIYGTINAQHEGYNGNIFVVNPAGVQIGPSAQINVGSLYVSNKYLNENELAKFNGNNITSLIDTTKTANAELMSLGNINAANNVTFDGNRIVLDTDRVIIADSQNGKLNIKTTDTNNVVLGYEAYDENNGYTDTVNKEKSFDVTKVTIKNGTIEEQDTNVKGYMWVEDVEQLQAINTNLGGNYALRNSIDATSTEQNGFNPIGINNDGKVIINNEGKYGFSGKFDGIDYNIFGLNINKPNKINVGLFGVAHDANINNVTLVGGSITGGSVVGSVVGAALGNTHITNATNSASVTGSNDVGGIVGYSGDEIDNVGENGETENVETGAHFTNLINTGTVIGTDYNDNKNDNSLTNTGGLIGYMYNGTLDGNSYNLGDVSSEGHNVGGLVGHAENSTIGDGTNLVYNRLDVEGAYNVGGIVGNMEGTTVQNAENSGNVTATEYTTGEYTYHTGETNSYNIPNAKLNDDGTATTSVNIANVGGIAGKADDTVKSDGNVDKKSEIKNVTNSGNISSSKQDVNDFYDAGNVGGIVGSAVDTNITNATNRENEVRGAHNVGGVAGYFGNSNDNNNIKYTINRGINDGGDIMATGARNGSSFETEIIRPVNKNQTEKFIIGNLGGIAGYMDGDNVYITGSGNRGTVHTYDEFTGTDVPDNAKAANVGGIVGKIDRSDTKELDTNNNIVDANNNPAQAAVSDSYNTGDVLGYTGIGGIAGLMYNGEIASSYNLGYLRSTRQSHVGSATGNTEVVDALNMGGIVGDTTEESNATALLYDVYNKGQIGDKEFNYFGRHVGGVVGRLSGTVEKAYNTGAIYNGYNVVGGIAGWVAKGTIQNAFNTGNITVYNKNENTSQLGGIVGAANGGGGVKINNVYNLGTLRSFDVGHGSNAVAGILGAASGNGTVTITNAYTTGNLYSGKVNNYGSFEEDLSKETVTENGFNNTTTKVNSIYAATEWGGSVTNSNTYYIRPDTNLEFTDLANEGIDNSNKDIAFGDKDKASSYSYHDNSGKYHSLTFTQQVNGSGDVDGGSNVIASDDNWRIYAGNTPILNAFLPNAENYFSQTGNMEGISSIQYGTAYDPLLTIINAANGTNNLSYNWSDLGISSAAGIAVYGAGLTLKDITTSGGTGYFGGTIYADGALNLNSNSNIGLGSAAQIYGSAVNIDTKGKVTIYGDVTATGNTANGATVDETDKITVNNAGNISINASDVDVYGTLTTGKNVSVPGIEDQAVNTWTPGDVENPYAEMVDIADRFAHETTNFNVKGDITITANGVKDENDEIIGGNVNLYYGNKQEGLITTGGNLTVTGEGDVYVDSDLAIGGDLTLSGNGANSEVVLDLTNIGQVQAKNGTIVDAVTGLHNFMHHFSDTSGGGVQADNKTISLNSASGNSKITVDMWDYENDKFSLEKYDETTVGGHTFREELNNLNLKVDNTVVAEEKVKEHIYIWVSDGEQLQGINATANDGRLDFNYALKGDINASDVENYVAIGTGSEFTGTFDGRGNRIIGLDTTKRSNGNDNTLTNAGIFSTIGEGGTVKNVNIYSGNFTGTDNAGAVAGVNKGSIENVVTFGNRVEAHGSDNSITINDKYVGAAGGIAGINDGDIYNVETTGTVIAGSAVDTSGALSTAGGIVGINGLNNNKATVDFSYSDSAVTASDNSTYGLGGVAGVNNGTLSLVDSLGVTRGLYVDQNANYIAQSGQVGGIVGINNNTINSGYNESIVTGLTEVGGIAGVNVGNINSVVNAVSVTGDGKDAEGSQDKVAGYYVGGLVGTNNGSVTDGRNNGTITGNEYVGGMVGSNANGSTLSNLVNGESADIIGENYVGGIAGKNSGSISANDSNLENRGSITGQNYVGGVAGLNTGSITNTNNDVSLNVKDSTDEAQYFGGVVGKNEGKIEKSTNSANIVANGATYVGGITGHNTGNLVGMGNSNKGNVVGKDYVGGVIGWNEGSIGSSGTTVEIVNSGIVEATAGGAGGLIAYNKGDLTNVEMTNAGKVTGTATNGTSGTGGLIGYNEGDITGSVLENTVGFVSDGVTLDGDVTGLSNVGGVIGVNTGKIENTSLMNKADITVTVGENQNAENIGGLIGKNIGEIEGGRIEADGKTDAGYYKYQIYNNGTITVTGKGENIGGLIGHNADETASGGEKGSLTAGYNTGAINASGSTNVGGIAGANSGTLDQVFNTVMTETGSDAIIGGNNVGGLVGTNSGTLSNAYNTTEVKSTNNGVVGNAVGKNINKVENIYGYSELVGTGDEATNSYVIDDSDKWKQQGNYKGFDFAGSDTKSPVWKNYDGSGNPLLKVFLTTLTVDSNKVDLVYNAGEQDLNIGQLVQDGIISAPVVTDDKDNIIYDGMDAYHNTVIKDETNKLGNSELLQNTTGQKDAGTYDNWLYSEQIASGSKDGSGFNPNNLGYDIVYTKNDSGETGVEIGKATINIDLGKVEHTYGNADVINGTGDFKNEAGYGFGFNITNSNLTQEMKDELNDKGLGFVFEKDNALTDDTSGRVTEDVKDGGYTWSANFELSEELKKNYQFDDNGSATLNKADGQSIVNQAKLEISVDDAETMPGVMPGFTGKVEGLTNGDDTSLDYVFGLGANGNSIINVDGRYDNAIGIVVDGKYYELNATWTDGLFKNYNVTYNMGTLTVDSEVMPDLPDNWPNNRWDYLFGDNPFDRNENFRERKAEVNFVDGAMEI